MKYFILVFFYFIIFVSILYGIEIPYNLELNLVSDNEYGAHRPEVAVFPSSEFVVCWESFDQDGSLGGIYCQLFDSTGLKKGEEIQVNTYTDSWQEMPSLSILTDSTFVVCWQSQGQGGQSSSIYFQILGTDSKMYGQETLAGLGWRGHISGPKITKLQSGNFVICWTDQRNIFMRIFNSIGQPLTEEVMVSDFQLKDQTRPQISAFTDGGFVICWDKEIKNSTDFDIFFQLFDANGNKQGGNRQANLNSPDLELDIYSYVSSFPDGRFIVSWYNSRFAFPPPSINIYAQIFDRSGEKIGTQTLLQHSTGLSTDDHMISGTQISIYDDNKIILSGVGVWPRQFQNDSIRDILCQMYDYNLNEKWEVFRANDFTYFQQAEPTVKFYKDGSFLTVWSSTTPENQHDGIYAKYYLSEPIEHDLINFNLVQPRKEEIISTTIPTFIWREASELRECYPWELKYDLYLDTSEQYDNYFLIKDIKDTTFLADTLDIDKTYYWKICAKNLTGDSLLSLQKNWSFHVSPNATEVEVKHKIVPQNFTLYQNYPNPFNPATSISLEISKSSPVRLDIYNLNGRIVKTLIEGRLNSGLYSVLWDGINNHGVRVASGVYIYRLKTDSQSESRKMLLLR